MTSTNTHKHIPNVSGLLRILEIPGSNLGPGTDCSDWFFVSHCSVFPLIADII